MNHTQGEWFYYDKAIQVTDGDNDTYIAWIQYPFTDEGRANASLIAAAPKLLKWLKRTSAMFCDLNCAIEWENSANGMPHSNECYQIMEALAEAEGESK